MKQDVQCFKSVKSTLFLNAVASSIQNKGFASSDGCNCIKPRFIQRLAPLITTPSGVNCNIKSKTITVHMNLVLYFSSFL